MMLGVIALYVLTTFTLINCQLSNEAIDSAFLESVLDAEECDRQIQVIRNNAGLGLQFADAGIRIPKGVLEGGTTDFGNYHQCLRIEHSTNDMNIEGKYCAIQIPLEQTIQIPIFGNPTKWIFESNSTHYDKTVFRKIEQLNLMRAEILAMSGNMDALEEYNARTSAENPLSGLAFTFGVCVPKPCTTQQAMTSFLFNLTEIGFNYTENYCRLPGDKRWSGADVAAVVVFSVIGCITLLSTCYDLYHRLVLKTDDKKINTVYQAFSVYTNTKRLTSFSSGGGNLQCIDGIRVLAMLWVIIGHTFGTELVIANPLDSFTWMISAKSLWITAGTMTVDTFFALTGVLLVYTTAGKMNGMKLIKNLHWFYMSRVVRVMPLVAVAVLLEASFYNHMGDGPFWQGVAIITNRCRNNWWYTVLNVQNIFAAREMCVPHSWYVAIDIHLYIISPLVLFWVLSGNKRSAWMGLLGGLIVTLTASTVYSFMINVQAGVRVPSRDPDERVEYMAKYYFNTFTRAGPFFIGLMFGYLLHLCRGKKVEMPGILVLLLWIWSFGIMAAIFYFKHRILQPDWNNQFMDNFMNSFMRPAWGCVIGWLIFACTHGYGGPINWFLSLDLWRLPARLSYGMYLFHYPLMWAINATAVTPAYFTPGAFTFKFLAYLMLSVVVSYILTVLIDSPISTLYRQWTISVQPKKKDNKEIRQEVVKDKMINGVNTESRPTNETDEIRHRNVPEITIK